MYFVQTCTFNLKSTPHLMNDRDCERAFLLTIIIHSQHLITFQITSNIYMYQVFLEGLSTDAHRHYANLKKRIQLACRVVNDLVNHLDISCLWSSGRRRVLALFSRKRVDCSVEKRVLFCQHLISIRMACNCSQQCVVYFWHIDLQMQLDTEMTR